MAKRHEMTQEISILGGTNDSNVRQVARCKHLRCMPKNLVFPRDVIYRERKRTRTPR